MLSESPDLQPVTISFERHHEFVGKRVKNARCGVCRRGQHFIEHLGYPEPLDSDSGTDPLKWQTQKKAWQEVFGEALHASGLPRGHVESVQVIAHYTFADRQRRDRDNLVYPFCKFLGDTLVRGRYTTVPYEAIDWTDDGIVAGRKLHRRLVNGSARDILGLWDMFGGSVRLQGRTFTKGEPVYVADPLGGWIPDDRWDRFEVIEMAATHVPGREALEVMLLPNGTEPGPWPPTADQEDLQLTASLGGM